MTDDLRQAAERICEFMGWQTKARCNCVDENGVAWPDCTCDHGWRRMPLPELTLDRLHLVEARLSDEQRLPYWLELSKGGSPETGYWRLVHATSEQKIRALGSVLEGVK